MTPADPIITVAARQGGRWARARVVAVVVVTLVLLAALASAVRIASVSPVPGVMPISEGRNAPAHT